MVLRLKTGLTKKGEEDSEYMTQDKKHKEQTAPLSEIREIEHTLDSTMLLKT